MYLKLSIIKKKGCNCASYQSYSYPLEDTLHLEATVVGNLRFHLEVFISGDCELILVFMPN